MARSNIAVFRLARLAYGPMAGLQDLGILETGVGSGKWERGGVKLRLTAVPADVEDGVKVLGVADEFLEFLRILEEWFLVLQKVHGYLVGFVDGARVQWRFTAGGGGDGYLGVGRKFFVGMRELGLDGL